MPEAGARSAASARPPGVDQAEKKIEEREEQSGALAPAYVSHGKSVWIIGDYAHEMVDVAHAVGYRTGHVQLVQRCR